jgi:hypothetical protein
MRPFRGSERQVHDVIISGARSNRTIDLEPEARLLSSSIDPSGVIPFGWQTAAANAAAPGGLGLHDVH